MCARSVFEDFNENGIRDDGEAGRAGITIYSDTNGNAAFELGEPSAQTDAAGHFTLAGLVSGATAIRQVVPEGSSDTTVGKDPGRFWGSAFVINNESR